MSEQKFLIDTNSFIAPYRQYYAFDFTRAFWEQLEQNINDGKIVMLDMVLDEKYSLQGTTQGRYLTGGVPPVRFSM